MSTDLPPPEPGEQPVGHDEAPRRTRRSRRTQGSDPNYALRRLIAIGVVVAAFAAIAVGIIWNFAGSGDDPDVTAPGWDVVVEIDRVSGDRTVIDRAGDEVGEFDGNGRAATVETQQERLAIIGRDRIELVASNGDESIDVELPSGWDVRRLPTMRSLTLVASPGTPGATVIVDGRTGAVLDVGELAGQDAPVLFADALVADADGTAFAIGDGANFQTVVVRIDADEATFFPGVPMAVGSELVVTSTNVGRTAEIGVFDAEGARLTTVSSTRPVGGILDEDRFVYATVDGEVLVISPDAEEPDELGSVSVPGDDRVRHVVPGLDGSRLVLIGDRFLAVVDLDGDVVYQTTFTAERDQVLPWATWRCVPVGGADHGHAIVDLDSGSTLADLSEGVITSVSADGCTVHLSGDDGSWIVSADGSSEVLDGARDVVLAPDGTVVVVVGSDGRAALVPVTPGIALGEDPDAEVVDLGVRRGLISFAMD